MPSAINKILIFLKGLKDLLLAKLGNIFSFFGIFFKSIARYLVILVYYIVSFFKILFFKIKFTFFKLIGKEKAENLEIKMAVNANKLKSIDNVNNSNKIIDNSNKVIDNSLNTSKGAPIKLALHELKQELVFLDLFNVILNTIIVFLVSLLLFIVVNVGWEWAVVVSLSSFFIFAYNYLRKTRLINVEEKVPELAERLRTAADNVDKDNEITNDLKQEVVKDMKKIQTKFFLDVDTLIVRLFSITIISFLIVILSFMGLTFDFEFSPVVSSPITFLKERAFNQDVGKNASLGYTMGNLSNVYGNKTALVKLGDQKLELTLNPLQSELDFNDIKDAQTKNFNPPVYPKEIYTSYDASYNEVVAKKNQAVVKSYFEEISK